MRIFIHVSSFYDWEPVPADVEVTEADIKALRVKPADTGGWLMRVSKSLPNGELTHTDVQMPEGELVALIIDDAIKQRNFLNRAEAAGHYVARHVAAHNFHRAWVKSVEALDEGGEPEKFAAEVDRFVEVGRLSAEDKDDLLERYAEQFTTAELEAFLQKRLGVKKKQEVT